MEWQIGNLPAALRSVPRNQGYWTGEGEDHERIPVGQYCHKAAKALDAKDAEIKDLKENLAILTEGIDGAIAIAKYRPEDHDAEETTAEVQKLITKTLGK